MTITCAHCHRTRAHKARHLCAACWAKAWRLGCLKAYPCVLRGTGQDRRTYWREWKRARKAAA